MSSLKIKKEDNVTIIAGKDKGKVGRILKVDSKSRTVLVQGLNIVKKHQKAKSQQEKGKIVEIEAPLDISNVMVNCKKCGPTRVSIQMDGDKKVRKCSKCGDVL